MNKTMRAFYLNKDFGPAKNGGFIEHESEHCAFIFEHSLTDNDGLHFRVHAEIEGGNGRCECISQFIYPHKKGTRASIIEHYRAVAN